MSCSMGYSVLTAALLSFELPQTHAISLTVKLKEAES